MEKQKGKVVIKRVEDNVVPDPGTGQAIPIDRSGQVPLVIAAGGETNTLADPAFRGQEMMIYAYSVAGGGTRAVSAASRVNVAAQKIMTFDAEGDMVVLKAGVSPSGPVWAIIANDGVALS